MDRAGLTADLTPLPFGAPNATVPVMPKGPAMGRIRRAARCAALVLATLFLAAASPRQPQRIVAIGDLHGDYSVWLDIARGAGLIDSGNHWAGGKTVLVQLGDVTDRGPDSLKIVRSLQQLQKEASRAGGRVIVTLGNHEAMNLVGDDRYTTPGEYAAFADGSSAARRDRVYELNHVAIEAAYHAKDPKLTPAAIRAAWLSTTPLGWIEHRLAWGPAGELGRWATHNPAIAKVGGTLFVHGGLSAEYSKLPMDELNKRVAAAMAAGDNSEKSILYDPLGPLWYRGLTGADPDAEAPRGKSNEPRHTIDQELSIVLSAYGANRLVIGHTPNLAGIVVANGGRLARIDTGNSRYYGGIPSWLEILGDRMIPHTVRRSAP
jgi:hypothetical protein